MSEIYTTTGVTTTISSTTQTTSLTNTYEIESKTQAKANNWRWLIPLSLIFGSLTTISPHPGLNVTINSPNEYSLGNIMISNTSLNSESKMEAVEVERQLKSESAPNVEKIAYHTFEPEIIDLIEEPEDFGYLTFGSIDTSNKLKKSPVSDSSMNDIVFFERG